MEEKVLEVEDIYNICAACYSLNVRVNFQNDSKCSHCDQDFKGILSIPSSKILEYKVKSREDVNPSTATICSHCYCQEFKFTHSNGFSGSACTNCNSKDSFKYVRTRDLSKYPIKTVLTKPKISVCRGCEKEEQKGDPICSCGSSEFVKIVRCGQTFTIGRSAA